MSQNLRWCAGVNEIDINNKLNNNRLSLASYHRKSIHPEETRENLFKRLNRIEGQIRGLKRLIEKETYCDNVINQILACKAALNGVAMILLKEQLKSCINKSIDEENEEVLNDLLVTVQKLLRK